MQKHVVICSELGEGYGHIMGFRPLAQQLLAKGIQVTVITNRPVAAFGVLKGLNLTILPSPLNHVENQERLEYFSNYADIIYDWGYNDAQSLEALVHQWLALFNLTKPDAIICDHSPTAVLAASIANIKACTFGTGYYIPPNTFPLAPFIPISAQQTQTMHSHEISVLKNMNSVLRRYKSSIKLSTVAQLFAQTTQFLFTLAELDHYNRDSKTEYFGPRLERNFGQSIHWQRLRSMRTDAKKIFAYLKPNTPKLPTVIEQIVQTQHLVVMHIPKAPAQLRQKLSSLAHVELSDGAVNVTKMLPQIDLLICNSGHGLLSAALLEAKHMLLLPTHIEQMILTKKMVHQKLATGINLHNGSQSINQQIEFILTEQPHTEALEAFKRKYAEVNFLEQLSIVVKWCEQE